VFSRPRSCIDAVPAPTTSALPDAADDFRHAPRQSDRAIDWQATRPMMCAQTARLRWHAWRAALVGTGLVHLHDGHPATGLSGKARGPSCPVRSGRGDRDCRWGRLDWPHARSAGNHPFKLPAVQVVDASHLPEVRGYDEINYREVGPIGFCALIFSTAPWGRQACERLLRAYEEALARPTKVLVLEGGQDVWSNGMDLNLIEAAASPADESWHNINAMDDLAEAILRTDDKLTVAAVGGNAGAGGVFLARACDEVWLRPGSCSTRTTRIWAISTGRSSGPTRCPASPRRARRAITSRPPADGRQGSGAAGSCRSCDRRVARRFPRGGRAAGRTSGGR
jgi:putative two-component system hydrogenase maturation factor HypX/HoxX